MIHRLSNGLVVQTGGGPDSWKPQDLFISIRDDDGEIAFWTGDLWAGDPKLILDIVNLIMAGVKSPAGLREIVG